MAAAFATIEAGQLKPPLEAKVQLPGHGEARIAVSDWRNYQSEIREERRNGSLGGFSTRMFVHGKIFALSDSAMANFDGRTAYVDRAQFDKWLNSEGAKTIDAPSVAMQAIVSMPPHRPSDLRERVKTELRLMLAQGGQAAQAVNGNQEALLTEIRIRIGLSGLSKHTLIRARNGLRAEQTPDQAKAQK